MKKILLCSLTMVVSCNTSQKMVPETKTAAVQVVSSKTYAETITEAELKEHLYIYASDEYQGRETGTPGQKKAVEYIKAQYKKMGISAAKSNGDYFQRVPLETQRTPSGLMVVAGEEYVIGEDFVSFTKLVENFKEIVYVGYGIEEGDYSDYKNLNVSGKIILVKSGEPKNKDGLYTISGNTQKSDWSKPSEEVAMKVRLAASKGAKRVLFYGSENFQMLKNYFKRLSNKRTNQMSLISNKEEAFEAYLSSKMAKKILADIDSNANPKIITKNININLQSEESQIESENVVAILKGSEKPEEYVVLSSHLDHIGVNTDGEINNGADDDGSGTVALLEIAQAFKNAADKGHRPKRSVVFLHVTGEEKGLLGSQYYTDIDPILPLENTVANLNIDMIGRIDPKREGDRNYIYLIGSDKLSTDLHKLSEEVNSKYMNIELDYTYNDENDPNRFYYRSDHYNFAKNNIPIIFYFNGTHDDYHRPTDTPDKINYDLLKNRTQLIFHTAWQIANRDKRIIVDKASN